MKCNLEICAAETLNQQEQDGGTAEGLNVLERDCSFICISQFGRELIKVFLRSRLTANTCFLMAQRSGQSYDNSVEINIVVIGVDSWRISEKLVELNCEQPVCVKSNQIKRRRSPSRCHGGIIVTHRSSLQSAPLWVSLQQSWTQTLLWDLSARMSESLLGGRLQITLAAKRLICNICARGLKGGSLRVGETETDVATGLNPDLLNQN